MGDDGNGTAVCDDDELYLRKIVEIDLSSAVRQRIEVVTKLCPVLFICEKYSP